MATSLSFFLSLSFSLVGLANNFVIHVFSRFNISTIVFSVMKTKTPYTTNLMIFELKQVMVCKNSFTSNQIRFNWTLNKLEIPTCLAHSTSLPTIHCWNSSISEKMIFPLLKKTLPFFFFPS